MSISSSKGPSDKPSHDSTQVHPGELMGFFLSIEEECGDPTTATLESSSSMEMVSP